MPPCRTGVRPASPALVALARLPWPAAGHLLVTCGFYRELGAGHAYHLDLAAAGVAAAVAVAAGARTAGGAGYRDGPHGDRGGSPWGNRVRAAVGQRAARDRDRAAQPASVQLGQGPRPARGAGAQ